MTLIECKNLCFDYDGIKAVDNINFTLESKDYLCIVGENGSGKSTLIKGLLGLIPVSSGQIDYKGIQKNEIGYMPQKTNIQREFPASVNEVVMSGNLRRDKFIPFYNNSDRCRANDNLKLLGIIEIKNKSFSELSGGQQQRVLLARTLCAAKKMVVLDEPVSNLDPVASNDFYKLLYHLNSVHSLTVMMVSHDVQSAVQYANKILHLDSKQLFFGSKDEYIKTDYYKRLGGISYA